MGWGCPSGLLGPCVWPFGPKPVVHQSNITTCQNDINVSYAIIDLVDVYFDCFFQMGFTPIETNKTTCHNDIKVHSMFD